MKNIVHVGCSGSGALGYAIKKGFLEGNRVEYLLDDLSCGPIDNINNGRNDWYKKIYTKNYFEKSDFEDNYKTLNNCMINPKDEEVCIWHGRNGKEFCGLLYILSLLNKPDIKIYTIDVSEYKYNLEQANEFKYRWLGEIIPEKFCDLMPYKKIVDLNRYSALTEKWNQLKYENTVLRIFKDESIISVSEDYLDDFILQYVGRKFNKCARTVGSVIGHNEMPVTEEYIFWRILELIKKGVIISRGISESMIEMEIKKNV